jgi:hypothetical protein
MKIICKNGGFYNTEIITDSGVELHKELCITSASLIPALDEKGKPSHWKLCLEILVTQLEVDIPEGQALTELHAKLKVLTPKFRVEVEE